MFIFWIYILLLNSLSDWLELLVLLHDLFVHLIIISIPSVSFGFPIKLELFLDIIRGNIFLWEASGNFPRSLSALFFIVTHGPTIFTCSLPKHTCLETFHASWIPVLTLDLLLGCWLWLFALILGVPGHLFDVLRSVLVLGHLSII